MTAAIKVRLLFHCTGPDGRQTMIYQMDVPIVSVPPDVTKLEEVDRVDVATAWWTFDHEVTVDGVAEPMMQINGVGPVSTVALGPYVVVCTYADDFDLGDPWSMPSMPTHVTAVPAIAVPESGLIV